MCLVPWVEAEYSQNHGKKIIMPSRERFPPKINRQQFTSGCNRTSNFIKIQWINFWVTFARNCITQTSNRLLDRQTCLKTCQTMFRTYQNVKSKRQSYWFKIRFKYECRTDNKRFLYCDVWLLVLYQIFLL